MSIRSHIQTHIDNLATSANMADTVTYRAKSGGESTLYGWMHYGDPETRPEVIHGGYLGDAQFTVPVSQISSVDAGGKIIDARNKEWRISKVYQLDDFTHYMVLTTETSRPANPSLYD